MPLTPTNLRCEYASAPLALDTANPAFSWWLDADQPNQFQSAYQVQVATSLDLLAANTPDLWDSGQVESDNQTHIIYDGQPLTSHLRACYRVRVWDAADNVSEYSSAATFETGLLNPSDFTAEWIALNESLQGGDAAPYLRKSFTLDKPVAAARVYIVGLGFYELEINGRKIGDHLLDPGQTDYEQRTFYVPYNVTENLAQGDNAIGVILGDGWYNQTKVWKKGQPTHGIDAIYGKPRLLLQLHITFTDGSTTTINTDDTWRSNTGPILMNNVYAGETYDANQEFSGWSTPGYDDDLWIPASITDSPGGKLVAQTIQPIRHTETLTPVKITNPKPGTYVYDLGQNFAGTLRITPGSCPEILPAGTTLKFRCTEDIYPDGNIDFTSTGIFATLVEPTITYTTAGKPNEQYQPRFTYFGFRYAELTGYPEDAGEPPLDLIKGIVTHTDVPTVGRFDCSDDMLNRIQTLALWTQRCNLYSIPTDCPAREKCGWLGDAHVTCEMTIFNYDIPQFWRKYIRDIETTRRGDIPWNIAPGRRLCPPKDPDWATAFILIPWYVYLHYGELRILEEHYNSMVFLMDHYASVAENHVINAGLGDWCPPGGARPKLTPPPLTTTAYYYENALIMARAEVLLGQGDGSQWQTLAKNIRSAFIDKFYDAENHTFGSQAANAIALRQKLMPDGEEQLVADSLAKDITENFDSHSNTGIMGSLFLYWSLCKYGYADLALTILHQKTYPSIGFLLEKGATTFYELWGEDYVFPEDFHPNSRSHPMQGGFTAWFYHGLAGINPDPTQPAYKHIILKPQMLPNLQHAGADFDSPRGKIASHWQRDGQTLTYKVTIPPNTTATIHLPNDEVTEITSGTHEFTIQS